ncbi:MAG: transcription termination/antitermination NusG family protein [Rikenellaceae bacterium]
MDIYLEGGKSGFRLYDQTAEGSYYYVMSTPPHKTLQVKQFLEENGIEAIVPLNYQDVVRRGKTSRELVSVLDNKVYIKADLTKIRWIKKYLPYLTYVKVEEYDGKWKKYRVYIENEIIELFRLLEANYLNDLLIVTSDDISDDNFTQIYTKDGIFKDIPLFFENVKGVDHKCLTITLDYSTVIAVRSLTLESFMIQECEMTQVVDGEFHKTYFPVAKVAN